MVLIVEDESTLVPHSESNVLQDHDIVMDVAQDDPNDNNAANAVDVMNTIPQNYISRHWCNNPLLNHLRDKRHRNDPDKLRVFLSKVKDLKKDLEIDAPSQNVPQNKDALYEDLLGVKAPVRVLIKNPKDMLIRVLTDLKCGQVGHNRQTCDEKKIDDADYAANKQAYEEAHKRAYKEANKLAFEEVNKSDEDEEVNESEEDYDVDEYDDADEDDELDKDNANDGYDENEDDA
ncbi:hypothetical protein Tco_1328139 [Tanacetum coccineum]